MPSPSKAASLVVITIGLVVGAGLPAVAAETASSDLVIITEGDTVEGDLYATGLRVLIEGVVEGDLVAFAAEEISISGEVTGSVVAVAPSVTVAGHVGGSARVLANDLKVSGSVGGDVVGAVVSGGLESGSTVGGDALIWAVNLTSAGSIGGDLGGTQRRLDIEGSVGGDVDVSVGRLAVTGPLRVSGDFGYRSGGEAEGLDQVSVGGVIARKSPLPPNIRVRALSLLARILTVLLLTTTAILVAWGWPERTRRAGSLARSRLVRAWAYGALVVLSPLILAGIAALLAGLSPASASLPLLVIFIPLVMAASGLVLVLSLVAGIPSVLALGEALPGGRGANGSIVLGSIVVGFLWLLPVVGWLVPLVVLPVGLGAWMLTFRPQPEPAPEPVQST
jgi:hypothetical protein